MKNLAITVCICTARRPSQLRAALRGLALQIYNGPIRVVVVENDISEEGLGVCRELEPDYPFPMECVREPRPGIAPARNAALRVALAGTPDCIAMLDDDEVPDPGWLSALAVALEREGADIASGTAEPRFDAPIPRGIPASLFFSSYLPTTANLLLRSAMMRRHGDPWFDKKLALSGGEDAMFLRNLIARGHRFAAAPDAVTRKAVPASRLRWRYIATRGLHNGGVDAYVNRHGERRKSLLRRLSKATANFLHALNHAFWSPRQRDRLALALDDACEGAGRLLCEFGYLHTLKGPDRADLAAPAVHTEPALIRVRCHDDWGDMNTALRLLTPGGRGVWDRVAFVRAGQADWVGIFDQSRRPVVIDHDPGRVFFAIGEPPLPALRQLHLGQGEGTTVFTCDAPLCDLPPPERSYVLTPCMTRSWSALRSIDQLRQDGAPDKKLPLSWVTSNKNFRAIPGHARRLAFLERLRGKVSFDLYGHGFNSIADKWDALAPYRYSIAFENCRAPWYFTEKLMDCFVAETMPLYFGSPEIARFFPADAMVQIDPDDPDIIERIEEVVRSDLWRKRREAIREARRLVLEEYNIFARLARFIMTREPAHQPPRRMRLTPVPIAWNHPP